MPYLAWLYFPSWHKAQGLRQIVMFFVVVQVHTRRLCLCMFKILNLHSTPTYVQQSYNVCMRLQ